MLKVLMLKFGHCNPQKEEAQLSICNTHLETIHSIKNFIIHW